MKKLYSTTMTNTGGRSGKVSAPDGSLAFQMAPPGTDASATNPEQLFAAGYASCFGSALQAVLLQDRIKAEATVTAIVTLYENAPVDYALGVEIEGHIEGMPPAEAQEYMQKAHQVCPYSKATRGNIEVTVKAV